MVRSLSYDVSVMVSVSFVSCLLPIKPWSDAV